MRAAFGRLLGGEWTDAWKGGHDYTPKPKSERHWYYYGEKSVVEIESADARVDLDG
jgi:hypothetical protein